jgi:hypothetical protein
MTLLGSHTAHELSVDMLNWQGFVTSMATSVAIDGDKWKAADPGGWAAWSHDWQAFRSQWDAAVARAQSIVDAAQSSVLGWDYTPVESDYVATLNAYQNGPVPSPGGYDDLYRRWTAAAKAPPIAVAVTIDPNAAPDADLNAYKAADATLKALPGSGPPMSLAEKVLLGVGAALFLGIVIKIAK